MKRRCAYCDRPYPVSDRVAAENPFCSKCLHERMAVSRERATIVQYLRDTAARWSSHTVDMLADAIEHGEDLPKQYWGVRYSVSRGVGPGVSWYWTPFRGSEDDAKRHAAKLESDRRSPVETARHYEACRLPVAGTDAFARLERRAARLKVKDKMADERYVEALDDEPKDG